jgi:hypothetical protein
MYYRYSTDIVLRNAERGDIVIMKDCLRESDKQEIWASDHYIPEAALSLSFNKSPLCFVLEYKGKPIAMAGAATDSLTSEEACIWLLATDDINKIFIAFVKLSLMVIRRLLEQYAFLYNYVDDRNKTSIKWLKWCGADFSFPRKYGREQMLFHYFSFKRRR